MILGLRELNSYCLRFLRLHFFSWRWWRRCVCPCASSSCTSSPSPCPRLPRVGRPSSPPASPPWYRSGAPLWASNSVLNTRCPVAEVGRVHDQAVLSKGEREIRDRDVGEAVELDAGAGAEYERSVRLSSPAARSGRAAGTGNLRPSRLGPVSGSSSSGESATAEPTIVPGGQVPAWKSGSGQVTVSRFGSEPMLVGRMTCALQAGLLDPLRDHRRQRRLGARRRQARGADQGAELQRERDRAAIDDVVRGSGRLGVRSVRVGGKAWSRARTRSGCG